MSLSFGMRSISLRKRRRRVCMLPDIGRQNKHPNCLLPFIFLNFSIIYPSQLIHIMEARKDDSSIKYILILLLFFFLPSYCYDLKYVALPSTYCLDIVRFGSNSNKSVLIFCYDNVCWCYFKLLLDCVVPVAPCSHNYW